MKQPKKLTYAQKIIVAAHMLKPDDWMFVSETDFYLKIINKSTHIIKSVDKFRKIK